MASRETALPRPIDADRLVVSVKARAAAMEKVTEMATQMETVAIVRFRSVLRKRQ
jgi:hypothetical protein